MKKLLLVLLVLVLASCKNEYSELYDGIWKLTSVEVINFEEALDSLDLNDSTLSESLLESISVGLDTLLVNKGVCFRFTRKNVYYLEIRNDSLCEEDILFYRHGDTPGELLLDNGGNMKIQSVENGRAIVHIDVPVHNSIEATQVFELIRVDSGEDPIQL